MKKIISLLIVLLIFSGCGNNVNIIKNGDKYSFTDISMDTVIDISAYGRNAPKALKKAHEELKQFDEKFSAENPKSFVYQLNSKGKLKADDEFSMLIKKSTEYSELTGNAFDITIYPIMKLWGFPDKKYRVPSETEIKSTLEKTGIDKITIKNNEVILSDGAMTDFGGIAKGYAGDVISAIIKSNGVESAVISLGGNVQLVGRNTNGEKWTVAVENPLKSDEYIGVVKGENCAVVTSGGYRRFFEKDGKKYHHIINPKTGKPADNGIISATVVTESGMYADALSTALFVMGEKKAKELYEKEKNFEMILVTEDKRVIVSPGLKKDFTPAENSSNYIYCD